MAPAQCPRQVLIWTLPALAVLISFFWYKRKKTLRSDPGGTTPVVSCEQVDSQSLELSCITTVNSDKVIAAIEKAKRDLETSRAIEEVVLVEDAYNEIEEEEKHAGKACEIVNDNKETCDNYLIKEVAEITTVEFSTPSSGKEINAETFVVSTPIDAEGINNVTIDLDSSVDICEKETISETSNSVIVLSSSKSSLDENDIKLLEEQIIEISSDSAFSVESSLEKKEIDCEIKKIGPLFQQSCKRESVNENKIFEEDICVQKVSYDTTIEDNVVESPSKANRVNKGSGSKKRSNKKPLKDSNSNTVKLNKTEINDNKVEEGKLEERKVLNGDCNKREKLNSKHLSTSADKLKNAGSGNNKSSKMELACSRVEQLGHNSSSSTINGNEAGLEQKLATLELESSRNLEGGERDSANHSPAEVMLASPSMSNFSDAHSEGSSDSGKGCSDIPDISTPPPQTPAGGSSVAGDLIPSVYEFIIPQYMVGRLIGRHGVFLHDIRSKTHTHIFIKRHPDTTKLKICAIEGAQQDIDAALAMIRQKFPLRRFPNLTLEKVTFVNIMPSLCPLPHEQFQLQLIEGLNNDVILSSLISAGHFFLQQPMHPSYQSLSQLNLVMNTVYNSPEAPILDTPLKDAICAAPAMGGWYRAQIIDVDEENKSADVRFLDYGGFLTLETAALRKIRGDLMLLPFQAVECLLANVIPAGGEDAEWTEDARVFVQNLTCGQILQAHISEYTETGIPLVFLYAMYCGQVVVVNQELVNSGFAESYTPPVVEE